MNTNRWRVVALALVALAVAVSAQAGQWRVMEDSEWCDDTSRKTKYCEVRVITLTPGDEIIASATNGSIRVVGWDKDEIRVEARIRVHKGSRSDARETASEVEIETEDNEIYARGPRNRRLSFWRGNSRDWSVDYRIKVPHNLDVAISSTNGSLLVDEVTGDIVVNTTNGSIKLYAAGGNVKGSTTNGSIFVGLTDDNWNGDGLDLSTTNGSIKIELPHEFSADIDARTVNGSIRVDHPVQIEKKSRRGLRGTIGDGGPLLRARTTNGGVSLTRRDA